MTTRRLTDMRNGDIGRMYRANKIYSSSASTAKHGTIISVHHNGRRLAVQAKPIAPVADYEAWLRGRNYRQFSCPHNRRARDGAALRRIVIMRRQGSTWKECGEALGISGSAAKNWVEFLPFELSI
jgi:hypothetical protein